MTRSAVTADRSQKGGAAIAAPLRSPRTPDSTERPSAFRRRLLAVFALCGLLLAAARLVSYIPAVQEWRLAHASLPALLRERGSRSDDPRLLYHVGLRLNQQGRFAEAESNLRRAVGLDPESPRLRDEWTRALLGTGHVTEAFTQLRQFVGTHPDSASAHLILGKFYFAQQSMQRAREEFERTTTLAPDDAEAWAYLSQAANQLSVAGT